MLLSGKARELLRTSRTRQRQRDSWAHWVASAAARSPDHSIRHRRRPARGPQRATHRTLRQPPLAAARAGCAAGRCGRGRDRQRRRAARGLSARALPRRSA